MLLWLSSLHLITCAESKSTLDSTNCCRAPHWVENNDFRLVAIIFVSFTLARLPFLCLLITAHKSLSSAKSVKLSELETFCFHSQNSPSVELLPTRSFTSKVVDKKQQQKYVEFYAILCNTFAAGQVICRESNGTADIESRKTERFSRQMARSCSRRWGRVRKVIFSLFALLWDL